MNIIRWVTLISLFSFCGSSFAKEPVRISKVEFGKYDEHAFFLYEKTNKIPKKNRVVSAVVLKFFGKTRCNYKFVLKMPSEINNMIIWDFGEWKKLVQGDQHSNGMSGRSETHTLDGRKYTIQGSYNVGSRGGYLRGVYKGESLPLGRYNLLVYINEELIKTIKFKVVLPAF